MDTDVSSLLDQPLPVLLERASQLRDSGSGRLVTYRPKVFIPLTKLCRDVCHYCTFARPPRRGERAYMTLDEVLDGRPRRRARRLPRGAVHARRQARAPLPRGARRARRARLRDDARLPRRRGAGGARADLAAARTSTRACSRAADFALLRPVAASMGMMLETTVGRGSRSGEARTSARPTSCPPRGSRRCGSPARRAVPFTTGILIGIGETRAERIEALRAIAAAGAAHPGGDRPELPRQARDADGRGARAAARGAALDDRRRAPDPAARRSRCRRRRT